MASGCKAGASTARLAPELAGRLGEYQQAGVKWLYAGFHGEGRAGRGGILGDGMGLGKTVQTVSFVYAVLAAGRAAPSVASPAHATHLDPPGPGLAPQYAP